jgi:hypothetical protein
MNSIFLRVIFKAREAITPIYRAYLIDRDNRIASYKPIDANTEPRGAESRVPVCRRLRRGGLVSIAKSGGSKTAERIGSSALFFRGPLKRYFEGLKPGVPLQPWKTVRVVL